MVTTTRQQTADASQANKPTANQPNDTNKPKLNIKYRTPNTAKRAEAQVAYLKGVTNITLLAKQFGVSRNTIMTWRSKDRWDDQALHADHQLLGKEAQELAAKRSKRLASLTGVIEALDKMIASGDVKPKTLEGLVTAWEKLIKLEQLLTGGATSRHEAMIIKWQPVGKAREPRTIKGEVLPGDSQTPSLGAPGNVDNTGSTEGGQGGKGSQKDGLIENCRGQDEIKNTPGIVGGGEVPQGIGTAANAPAPDTLASTNAAGPGRPEVSAQGSAEGTPAPAMVEIRLTGGGTKLVPADKVMGANGIPITRQGQPTVLDQGTGTREQRRTALVGKETKKAESPAL